MAPLGDTHLSTRISELELRICALPLREEAFTEITSQQSNLLQIWRCVADDGSRSVRGLLAFFSLTMRLR